MCAGTIYWAGIGGLVYGAAEEKLRALTGNHPENPTLALPCRAVLDTGARPTTVVGPVPEMEAAVLAPHQQVRVSQPHSRRGVPADPSARVWRSSGKRARDHDSLYEGAPNRCPSAAAETAKGHDHGSRERLVRPREACGGGGSGKQPSSIVVKNYLVSEWCRRHAQYMTW